MSTIGILDNQSLVVNYSFTKDTIHSTILPMLNTLTPLGELIHSFIHARTGEIIHIAPSHITINKSQKEQLEGILYNLNRASILRE